MFNKQWFEKHQEFLVRFANNFVGKLIFGFYLNQTKIDNKIVKISPNSVHWLQKKTKKKVFLKAEFLADNQYSDRLKTFFYPILLPIHLWDIFIANVFLPAWNFGLDTLEVNSNSGGDGAVALTNNTYATVHDAASGATLYDTQTDVQVGQCSYAAPTYYFSRGYFPFDTSAIGVGPTITSAVLSLYITDYHNADTTNSVIVLSTQTSNTALALGDYSKLGTTNGGQISNALTIGAYANITLNATGLSWISQIG